MFLRPPRYPSNRQPKLSRSSSILRSIVAPMFHHHHALVLSFNPFNFWCHILHHMLPAISIPTTSDRRFDMHSSIVSIPTSYIWLPIVYIPSTSDRVDRCSYSISIPSTLTVSTKADCERENCRGCGLNVVSYFSLLLKRWWSRERKLMC
jgi:hypothetical protein